MDSAKKTGVLCLFASFFHNEVSCNQIVSTPPADMEQKQKATIVNYKTLQRSLSILNYDWLNFLPGPMQPRVISTVTSEKS